MSNALEKINDRIASHQVWGVRLLMKPGGCGGWEWELKYEDNPSEGDEIFYEKVAVDPMTLSFVEEIGILFASSPRAFPIHLNSNSSLCLVPVPCAFI